MVWLPTSTEEDGLTEEMEKMKGDDRREFYAHIFNGCYAVLMFVVVIFFLIYGVEVFFKVRGGFAVSNVPHLKGNTRLPATDGSLFLDPDEVQKRRALRKEMRRKRRENMSQGTSMIRRTDSIEDNDDGVRKDEEDMEDSPLHCVMTSSDIKIEEKYLSANLMISHKNISKNCQTDTNEKMSLEEQESRKSLLNIHSSQLHQKNQLDFPQCSTSYALQEAPLPPRQPDIYTVQSSASTSSSPNKKSKVSTPKKLSHKLEDESIDKVQSLDFGVTSSNVKVVNGIYGNDATLDQFVNTSQLHQSRLGLLSQALMMIITVGFLFSETLEEFWKTKVDLTSRNTHDIIFRIIEIGVALWFPCVLWNCIRPEQLWCLNPKKILDRGKKFKSQFNNGAKGKELGEKTNSQKQEDIPRDSRESSASDFSTTDEDEERVLECWICYDPDRTDVGPMINPCECRGDVSAVHHDCLQRWLMEYAESSDALKCKVCGGAYEVEKGSEFSLSKGFTAKQWLQTASYVTIMCLSVGGSWAVIQLYSEAWIRTLAVGAALFVLYLCLRSLGLNTVSAYQRAKVMTLKIVNFRRSNHNSSPRDASTARNIDMRNGTSAPPIIKKQKGKYSRASPPKNPSNSRDQARLSMEQIEPIRPSNIVTNTHKTRI